MAQCVLDTSLTRVETQGFKFPLGVFPTKPIRPKAGYTVMFEPADGGEEDDWEEWPDRYVFEVVMSAERLGAFTTAMLNVMPPRVYPILDVLGHDAYREIDPYIAYELIGIEHFIDGIRRYRPFLLEDGLCGFGVMCDDPFIYLFLDEHKIATIRCRPDERARIEAILHAFDLEEIVEPVGVDASEHEHRTVLLSPESRDDLLDAEEVTERLVDGWRLTLNIDAEANEDADGAPLGMTPWRVLVRVSFDSDEDKGLRTGYAEILLEAPNYRTADEAAQQAALDLPQLTGGDDPQTAPMIHELVTITADRMRQGQLRKALARRAPQKPGEIGAARIHRCRWLG